MDGKLPEVLKDIPHKRNAVFRNLKDKNGMGKSAGVDHKLSFMKGFFIEMHMPILCVLIPTLVGYYFYGPYGLLFGVVAAVLYKIKSKLLLGEKLKVGMPAPDGPVVTMDGTSANLLSYGQTDRPLILNFGSFS